ncbi:MAG: hypothetical protein KGI42_00530 [Xanthomonadaceae bacterium]|nr:hypothetical protein [Xanthomonadaceae bacterium]
MRRSTLAIAATALVALAWVVHWRRPAPTTGRDGVGVASVSAHGRASRGDRSLEPASPGRVRPDPEQVLRDGSLRGTEVDGGVTIGFAGRVRPDLALRRLFDYYLSLLGETDLQGIRQLLREDLGRRPLDAGQQAAVMALFDRYVDYQQARTALAGAPINDVAARLAQDRALRQQLLGPDLARAFYPDAQADDARLLRQLAHHDVPGRSAADPRATASVADLIQTQTEQLDAAPLTPAQRHDERAAAWGEAAAGRLDALDRQRAQWNRRLAAFASAASALERDPALDDAGRRQALQRLLDQQFDGPERLQARAMWQAGLLPAGR